MFICVCMFIVCMCVYVCVCGSLSCSCRCVYSVFTQMCQFVQMCDLCPHRNLRIVTYRKSALQKKLDKLYTTLLQLCVKVSVLCQFTQISVVILVLQSDTSASEVQFRNFPQAFYGSCRAPTFNRDFQCAHSIGRNWDPKTDKKCKK